MSLLLSTLIATLLSTQPLDSLRTTDIEEVVVVATPKENQRLRQQALSSTSFSQEDMREQGIVGITDLSAGVPNLYIPSYGSHLTTSVYVRGIGSRTGTPAVSLYVDGVPQVSAASYDFNFSNVDRIDVLRGPQSVLYGRNSMGGVIRVYTKNPMQYQGTDITLTGSHVAGSSPAGRHDGGGAGHYKLNLTHYHRVNPQFAFSAHFFGERDGGYFRNEARGDEHIDDQTDLGARMRFIYRPKPTLDFDLTLSHEWLRQGGYPYEYRGIVGAPTTPDPQTAAGHIAYDNRSGYRRNLTHAGLMTARRWPKVTLTSVTGYQHLHDRMDLDQDFTDRNLYTLMQRQNQNTVSEELILKGSTALSEGGEPSLFTETVGKGTYSWLLGLSAIRQWAETDGPVVFHDDGLAWLNGLINQQANTHLPTITSRDEAGNEAYTMNFVFDNQILGTDLGFPGTYQTPATNVALFHQSTFSNLFGVTKLDLTAGLRLDYEHFTLHHDTRYTFSQHYGLNGRLTYPDGSVREGMTLVPARTFMVDDALVGTLHQDYLQLLPKLTLQWQPNAQKSAVNCQLLYASVSRGYRSGGYNFQMFSDLLQSRMQTAIMHNVADATIPVVESVTMIPADVKTKVRDMLESMGTQGETDVQAATWYKPESSWNYEVGAHINFFDSRLQADASLFLTDTRNQQVSKMSAGGLGRVTINSGKSRSYGAEASLRYLLTDQLLLSAAYGYTLARFRNDQSTVNSQYVPFVPRHTLSVGATQTWAVRRPHLSSVALHADYRGAGRIYWTEANDVSQAFVGQLNARLTCRLKVVQSSFDLSLWATNLLSTRYQTFYFETMQRGFAQYTRPVTLGIELRWRL